VVFAGLLKTRTQVTGADDASEAAWHSALEPPKLAFDHNKILRVAVDRMRLAS